MKKTEEWKGTTMGLLKKSMSEPEPQYMIRLRITRRLRYHDPASGEMRHANIGDVVTLGQEEASELAGSWVPVSDNVNELKEAAETLKTAARQEKREERKNQLLLVRWYCLKAMWELQAMKK